MAQRVRDLEAERNTLLDRLLVSHGAKPLHHVPVTAAELVSDTPALPVKTRRTPSDIAQMCTAAKAKEAQAILISKHGPPSPDVKSHV